MNKPKHTHMGRLREDYEKMNRQEQKYRRLKTLCKIAKYTAIVGGIYIAYTIATITPKTNAQEASQGQNGHIQAQIVEVARQLEELRMQVENEKKREEIKEVILFAICQAESNCKQYARNFSEGGVKICPKEGKCWVSLPERSYGLFQINDLTTGKFCDNLGYTHWRENTMAGQVDNYSCASELLDRHGLKKWKGSEHSRPNGFVGWKDIAGEKYWYAKQIFV